MRLQDRRLPESKFPAEGLGLLVVFRPIYQMLGDFLRAFSNRLTFEDNFAAEQPVLSVAAGQTYPMKVSTSFRNKPKVQVLDVMGAPLSAAPYVAESTFTRMDGVSTLYVTLGAIPNVDCRVTLLLLGEPL